MSAAGNEPDRVAALGAELEQAEKAWYAARDAVAAQEKEHPELWLGPNRHKRPFVEMPRDVYRSDNERSAAQDEALELFREREKAYLALREKHGLAELDKAESAAEVRYWELRTEFAQEVPTTLEGVAVKVRRLDPGDDEGGINHEVARSALESIERLAAGTSEDTATTIGETADAGDEHLLDLERRRLEAKAQRKKLNIDDDLPEDDPEDNRLYDLCFNLEKEIAEAPAHTVTGVAVKIRLLQESHEKDWDVYYADGFRTALEALERLGGAVPAPVAEDPIVGLWRQVLDHRDEASRLENLAIEAKKRGDDVERSRLSDLHGDADDKWQSIETKILQTDALTTEGWAIQAELLADQSGEQFAERIAQHFRRMADAEQLAASGDAKVRVLHAAWQEAQKTTKDACDRAKNAKENGQPNAKALSELADKIVHDEIAAYDRFIEAPAGTVPAMLLKLDAWAKHQAEDPDPAAPLAVMRDLKRLAGAS